uniref:Immunoglobulin V-set domain-containing protein n=1 Tax=Seriola dumerili TaxID=41447 RepID=A0A3B4T5Q8_SERDU
VCTVLLLCFHCQDVTQHPAVSWNYLSKSAEMNCSHKKDAGHNQMYWYRQRPGETMTLIVYTIYGRAPDYVQKNQTKYLATKENIENGALTVRNLQLEDSGQVFLWGFRSISLPLLSSEMLVMMYNFSAPMENLTTE